MIMAKIIKRTDSLTELPLTTASRRSLPPSGSREAADNFCLIVRKHDEARGSREAADNFCLIVRKHDEARGSREMRRLNGLYQKTSGAPHHRPNGQSLPPRGSLFRRRKNFLRKILQIPPKNACNSFSDMV